MSKHNRTLDDREKVLERVEELYLMGHRTAQQIFNKTSQEEIGDLRTAKAYLRIIQMRMRNIWKRLDLKEVLKKELQQLQMMERRAWQDYEMSVDTRDRLEAMKTIIKIKERRAKLLGMDNENLAIEQPKESKWSSLLLSLTAEENETNTDFG